MSREGTRSIDARGIITGDDWLTLPQTLYSETGCFHRYVATSQDLLQFLKDHRATPKASFDVQAVYEYYLEAMGDLTYSAAEFHIRSEHDNRNLLAGYEHLY